MLLLLLLATAIVSASICNESTYAEYFFDLCAADTDCQRNFALRADDATYFAYLLDTLILAPAVLNATDICASPALLLGILRIFPTCPPNQQPDSELGCVLRDDRLTEPPASRAHYDRLSSAGSILLLAAVTILILYVLFKVFRELADLRAYIGADRATPPAPLPPPPFAIRLDFGKRK